MLRKKEVDDPIGITDWVKNAVVASTQGNIDATLTVWRYYNELVQPYCKIELNNEKEKEKMNAKKCDRCGELYMETREHDIRVYLCGRVTENEKETYTPEKIKGFNTYDISIKINNLGEMDMCPECRKKLKNFFESGKDDPMDAAVNINDVIKKAEEI